MTDPIVELARSFSFKLNIGDYSSLDTFCSAKASCNLSEAGEMSGKLYDFCKTEVMAGIEEARAEYGVKKRKKKSTNSYSEELPPDNQGAPLEEAAPVDSTEMAQPTMPEIAAARPVPQDPKDYCSQLRDDIYRISKCTKDNLHSFYLGWFGATDGRQLPRKPETFVLPLKTLLEAISGADMPDGSKPFTALLATPRDLGSALNATIRLSPQEEEPVDYVATNEDVFDKDPVCEKFGWKEMQTAAIARAWMTEKNKTLEEFEHYLKFLNMLKLTEYDLQTVLIWLYHDTDIGFKLWKKTEHLNIPVGGCCQEPPIKLDTPHADAVRAMNLAFSQL